MADEITGDKVIHIMKYILTIKIDIKIQRLYKDIKMNLKNSIWYCCE